MTRPRKGSIFRGLKSWFVTTIPYQGKAMTTSESIAARPLGQSPEPQERWPGEHDWLKKYKKGGGRTQQANARRRKRLEAASEKAADAAHNAELAPLGNSADTLRTAFLERIAARKAVR